MANKPRSTKYWIKRKDKEGNEIPLPFFIEDHPNDWIEIKNRRELKDIFSQSVYKELNNRFSMYRIFVHKMDIYFTKGVYASFVEQLKKYVGEMVFNNVLFKNGFKVSDLLNWHVLRPFFEKDGFKIEENILEACISVENEKSLDSKGTDLPLVKPTGPKK